MAESVHADGPVLEIQACIQLLVSLPRLAWAQRHAALESFTREGHHVRVAKCNVEADEAT